MKRTHYNTLVQNRAAGKKHLAVLLDPDKCTAEHFKYYNSLAEDDLPDFFLVGGSLVQRSSTDDMIIKLKSSIRRPVFLFPGHVMQLSMYADGILFLSLVSGRNPDLLIGQHVVSAGALHRSKLEVISTGYILVDGGRATSVSYMSGTQPIPSDKSDIITSTALASQLLGHHQIYIDAGSGAEQPIASRTLRQLRAVIDTPIWVGGGIQDAEQVYASSSAGADVVVIGNRLEENPELLPQMLGALRAAQKVPSA